MIFARSSTFARVRTCAVLLTASVFLPTATALAVSTNDPRIAVRAGASITSSTTDPDDTAGRLDIARVGDQAVRVDRRHVLVTYRVRTYSHFQSQRLETGLREFVLELNRDEGQVPNAASSSPVGLARR